MSEETFEIGKEIDISDEVYRLYRFPRGETTMLKKPKTLVIDEKGVHHVIDRAGYVHEIPPGWIHLKYKKEGGAEKIILVTEKRLARSKEKKKSETEEKRKE